MRLNQFLAKHTDLSRRSADKAILDGRVEINGILARLGDTVIDSDTVSLDSHPITPDVKNVTLMLHKPVGFVCSRAGQGNKTIYELLPAEFHHLNPVGRLDKDSSGLLLMTNDGALANELTHPRYQKEKRYIVTIDTALARKDLELITQVGVQLEDGASKLGLDPIGKSNSEWQVTMHEGRNRQIRRTFAALGYHVTKLHRTQFGPYRLNSLKSAAYSVIM